MGENPIRRTRTCKNLEKRVSKLKKVKKIKVYCQIPFVLLGALVVGLFSVNIAVINIKKWIRKAQSQTETY